MQVCVTKFYPHYTGHPHYIEHRPLSIVEGSILCQTISPAQYRTPALYDPHYIGPPTVCPFHTYSTLLFIFRIEQQNETFAKENRWFGEGRAIVPGNVIEGPLLGPLLFLQCGSVSLYSGIVVTPLTGGRTGGHRQQHAAMLVLDKDDPLMIKNPEE